MSKYVNLLFIVDISLMFFLSGCQVSENTVPTQTSTQEMPTDSITRTPKPDNFPTSTDVVVTISSTNVPSATLTLTSVPSQPPTWTPLPTMAIDGAQRLVKELLETNARCRLPCWWGFTPGQTPWVEAEHFLVPVAQYIGTYNGETENTFTADAQIHIPAGAVSTSWESVPYLTQDYFVLDGIIQTINVFNFDLAPNYALPVFLKNYGQPSGVWIRTFREEERNSRPFLLELFYPEQGILMEYGGGELIDLGESLQNCLDKTVNSPFMYLWSPDQPLTFPEAKERFLYLDAENMPEPVPLQEATGTSVEDFYTSLITDGRVCIETPKALWP